MEIGNKISISFTNRITDEQVYEFNDKYWSNYENFNARLIAEKITQKIYNDSLSIMLKLTKTIKKRIKNEDR